MTLKSGVAEICLATGRQWLKRKGYGVKNNLIYVCSPYRGEVKRNKEYARELTRLAIQRGFSPVTVHLYMTEALDDNSEDERRAGMEAGQKLLTQCSFILLGERYGISEGMDAELKMASAWGKTVITEKGGKLYYMRSDAEIKCQNGLIIFSEDKKPLEDTLPRIDRWEDKTEAEKFKEVFRAHVNRRGSENLLNWLEINGFFTAPASTKYHGAYPGGLVEHSNNVLRRLIRLMTDDELRTGKQYSLETIVVVALLHDVCKMDVYQPDKQNPGGYKFNDPYPYGHGEKTVLYIMRHIYLTEEEALAIRWHMGPYDKAAQGDTRDLSKAFEMNRLAVLLYCADMLAAHLDEKR